MNRQCVGLALLAGAVTTWAALAARANDAPPAAAGPCTTPTRTVCETQWVPEQYQTFRTAYRTEYVQERYTAFRTECVPEVRTRVVTVNRMVPEVREEVRTVWVNVPTCEERTVMKRVVTCKPVTTVTRKCVDQGHYECREVPCGEGLWTRLKKACHKHDDCCEPCAPPPTKTVKVWVPNKVWVETPHTRMVRTCEYVPTVVRTQVCRKVPQQQTFKVCAYRCVPEQRTETYTVTVARRVPFEATRTVARCVPVQEMVTACRMVPRTVMKQVPVESCAPCEETCCQSYGPRPCCR